MVGMALALCVVGLFVVVSGVGATRTFIVEAQTTGAVLHMKGGLNDWSLGKAVLCIPTASNPKLPRGDGPCDRRRYVEKAEEELRLTWPAESIVEVSSPRRGSTVFTLKSGELYPIGTRISLPDYALEQIGALTFFGEAKIGESISSGETKILLSGTFEAREKPFGSAATEVLQNGTIRRGESIEILARGGKNAPPAKVFGSITAESHDAAGFRIGLASEAGTPALKLVYFGGAEPAIVTPNWIDRALTSSLFVVVALLLSLAVNIAQVLSSATGLLARARRQSIVPGSVDRES
jgi:hypothetical protein